MLYLRKNGKESIWIAARRRGEYDAFVDPFYVSREVPVERIQKFCATLGLTYETDKEDG